MKVKQILAVGIMLSLTTLSYGLDKKITSKIECNDKTCEHTITYPKSDKNNSSVKVELEWKRCPEGQTFKDNAGKCVKVSNRVSYRNAQNNNNTDWRLPTMSELMAYLTASAESGNGLKMDKLDSAFWTSTEFPLDKTQHWLVSAFAQEAVHASKDVPHYVLLVRKVK